MKFYVNTKYKYITKYYLLVVWTMNTSYEILHEEPLEILHVSFQETQIVNKYSLALII